MGDQIESSENIRTALLNLKSNLSQVSEKAQAIPGGTNDQKEELQRLLRELGEALQQSPPDRIEAAEAVVQAAEQLVNAATRKKPNKTLVKITGKSLTEAAQTLAETLPPVEGMAAQIVETVSKLA